MTVHGFFPLIHLCAGWGPLSSFLADVAGSWTTLCIIVHVIIVLQLFYMYLFGNYCDYPIILLFQFHYYHLFKEPLYEQKKVIRLACFKYMYNASMYVYLSSSAPRTSSARSMQRGAQSSVQGACCLDIGFRHMSSALDCVAFSCCMCRVAEEREHLHSFELRMCCHPESGSRVGGATSQSLGTRLWMPVLRN